MNLSRRGFLTGMLALGAAPAIVRAASLMRTVTPAGLIVASGDVLTLELLRQTRDRMKLIQEMTDHHVFIIYPSADQAMRELMVTGTTRIIYKREVRRHG